MNSMLSEKDAKAVAEILVEQLGVEESQLTPEARFKEDLGADSLTMIEISMALEGQFDVSVPDDVDEKVATVGALFEMLGDLLEPRPAKP